MPIGESFWNPYRMIPARDKVIRMKPLTDEKFKGKSGMIHCTIENLTPLFVGGNEYNKQKFKTRNSHKVIPGSSLKGMLRSIGELVGGGCSLTISNKTYENEDESSTEYKPCLKADYLCIACRIFGMMERGGKAKVHKGNISVSDAIMRSRESKTALFDVLLSGSGTRHKPFYLTPQTGKLDRKSRKLYFHQPKRTDSVPPVSDQLRERSWNIEALLPGHHFDFTVQFTSLSEEELNLLIYILALERNVSVKIGEKEKIRLTGPLRHKIGFAKPLGMGSCRISISEINYLSEPKTRFASLNGTGQKDYTGDELGVEIAERTKSLTGDSSITMEHFRKMMVWDKNDPREFKYPDYAWFRNPENGVKELKKI